MFEWLSHITENWPTAGMIVTALVAVFLAIRYFMAVEMKDMRSRVNFLDDRVEQLLRRDQCYFSYVLYDQNWHHKYDLLAVAQGLELPEHKTFLTYRDDWMKEHGFEKDLAIWKSPM